MKSYQEEVIKDLLQKIVDCMRTVNGILRKADQPLWFSEEVISDTVRVISDTVRVSLPTSPLALKTPSKRLGRPGYAIIDVISIIKAEPKGIDLDEIVCRLEAKNMCLGLDQKGNIRANLYRYIKKGEIAKRGRLYFPAGAPGEGFIAPLRAMSTAKSAISVIEAEPKGLDLDEIVRRLKAQGVDLGRSVNKRRNLCRSLCLYMC